MSQGVTSGSNAADFQPTTQDPQGNVGGGLQPGASGLQPVETNGSNVFNQPGVNAQAFPQTSQLKVQALTQVSGSTNSPDTKPKSMFNGITLFVIVLVCLFVGLALLVRSAKPAAGTAEKADKSEKPVKASSQPEPKPVDSVSKTIKKPVSKPKKKSKSKSRKKRK